MANISLQTSMSAYPFFTLTVQLRNFVRVSATADSFNNFILSLTLIYNLNADCAARIIFLTYKHNVNSLGYTILPELAHFTSTKLHIFMQGHPFQCPENHIKLVYRRL